MMFAYKFCSIFFIFITIIFHHNLFVAQAYSTTANDDDSEHHPSHHLTNSPITTNNDNDDNGNGSGSSRYLWSTLTQMNDTIIEQAFVPNYLTNFVSQLNNGGGGGGEQLQQLHISEQCYAAMRRSLHALIHERKAWAVKMFNAWGRFPPPGMMHGKLTDFGDYDQCLAAHSIQDSVDSHYCLLNIQLPMPQPIPFHHNFFHQTPNLLRLSSPSSSSSSTKNESSYLEELAKESSVFYYTYLQLGICLPKQCNKEDVKSFANQHLPKFGLSLKKFHCQSARTVKFENLSRVQIGAIIFIIAIVTLSTIATIYDRLHDDANKSQNDLPPLGRVLRWFSPLRNMRKILFSGSVEDELSCIHGLRFLTICWIIIGHTLEWNNLNIFRDVYQIKHRLADPILQPLFKGHYSVDTFFYISGLLSGYIGLQFTKGQYRYFSYSKFFFLRYVRLLPQLAAFLLLTMLLPVLFDGPIWRENMATMEEKCYKNWWQNLLFLQNLLDIENICCLHTWYIAADMQLHWLSLIPIIFVLRNRKIGIAITTLFLFVCMAITSITILAKNLPPGSVVTSKNDFLDEFGMPSPYIAFFHKPWNHANVFFIGFLFGVWLYVSAQKATKRATLSHAAKYSLWAVTLVLYLVPVYDTYPWIYGREYHRWISAVLYPLNGVLWSLMLTLLLWLCITNHGTIVGRFLSWSGFRPCSRITYSVYLCHVWVLFLVLGARRDLIDIHIHSVVILCFSTITVSLLVGFLFTITVEAPVINFLEYLKVILMKRFIMVESNSSISSSSGNTISDSKDPHSLSPTEHNHHHNHHHHHNHNHHHHQMHHLSNEMALSSPTPSASTLDIVAKLQSYNDSSNSNNNNNNNEKTATSNGGIIGTSGDEQTTMLDQPIIILSDVNGTNKCLQSNNNNEDSTSSVV